MLKSRDDTILTFSVDTDKMNRLIKLGLLEQNHFHTNQICICVSVFTDKWETILLHLINTVKCILSQSVVISLWKKLENMLPLHATNIC